MGASSVHADRLFIPATGVRFPLGSPDFITDQKSSIIYFCGAFCLFNSVILGSIPGE